MFLINFAFEKKNRSKMYLVGCVRMMTKEGEMDRERERESLSAALFLDHTKAAFILCLKRIIEANREHKC